MALVRLLKMDIPRLIESKRKSFLIAKTRS
jgi:hypothetical protein